MDRDDYPAFGSPVRRYDPDTFVGREWQQVGQASFPGPQGWYTQGGGGMAPGSAWQGYGQGGYSEVRGQPGYGFAGGGIHVGRGPKGYKRSDERIREDVSEELTRHPGIDASDIEVQVRDGEVTLTGTVEDRRTKRLAEDVAERVWGVSDVHNHLHARHGIGQKIADMLSGTETDR